MRIQVDGAAGAGACKRLVAVAQQRCFVEVRAPLATCSGGAL
jgi:hypothetical protein